MIHTGLHQSAECLALSICSVKGDQNAKSDSGVAKLPFPPPAGTLGKGEKDEHEVWKGPQAGL